MTIPGLARTRRFAARFRRARGGATAVEFGIVALPFIFMMFAILELGLVFVLDTTLENAVIDTGRLIRTGQAQAAGMNQAMFATRVCERMSIFSADCASRLTVDVRVIPRFRNQTPPDPMAGGNFSTAGLGYNGGGAESLILVSAWYRQPLFTPLLSQGLSRLNDGKAVLTATTSFRNEPF